MISTIETIPNETIPNVEKITTKVENDGNKYRAEEKKRLAEMERNGIRVPESMKKVLEGTD